MPGIHHEIELLGVRYFHEGLKDMTRSDMLTVYNVAAANMGRKGLKTFKDHTTAVERTWAMLLDYEKFDPETAPEPEKPAKAEPRPGPVVVRESKRRRFADEDVIVVLIEQNPHRQNTMSHTKFKLMRDGMTVRQYRALEGKTDQLDHELGWPLNHLRWAVTNGHVEIRSPKK